MMKLLVKCPSCLRNFNTTSAAADKRIKCRLCGAMFKVPKLSDFPQAIDAAASSKTSCYIDQDGEAYG